MGQIETFLLYITVILSCTFISHIAYLKKYIKYKKFFIFLIIFIMAIIAGIRYEVGSDWLQYFNGPKIIGNGQYLRGSDKGSYEIGYIIICKIIFIFGLNGSALLFVYAFLTYYFLFKVIDKYSKIINIPITVFMYGCLYYLVTFNITRQALAISISMYAISNLDIDYFRNPAINKDKILNFVKHNLSFILWSIVAFLFHQSAIVVLLSLPICLFMRKNNIVRIISLVIVVFFVINFKEFTQLAIKLTGSSSFQWYFIGSAGGQGSWIKYILRYLPILIMFWFSVKQIRENKKIFDIYNLVLVGLIINGLSVITSTEIERVGFPFLYFITIVLGFAFKNSTNIIEIFGLKIRFPDKTISLLKLFLCLFFVWTMWYIFFKLGSYEVVPYNTIIGI